MDYRTTTTTTSKHHVSFHDGPTLEIVETSNDGRTPTFVWSVIWDMQVVAKGSGRDLDDAKIKADVARRLVEGLRRLEGKPFGDGGYAIDRVLQPFFDRALLWLDGQGELQRPTSGDLAGPTAPSVVDRSETA